MSRHGLEPEECRSPGWDNQRLNIGSPKYGRFVMGSCPRTAAELAENFDFSEDEVRQNRTAVYAELRKGPPSWSEAYGGHWVVSRYDDLKEMLANTTVFC